MPKSVSSNNLDLIRLLAALQVAVKHILIHFGIENHYVEVFNALPGVPIFFLLSGFLIFQSFNNSKSTADFFRNRFLRIYPALFVCYIFTVFLILISDHLSISDLKKTEFAAWAIAQLTVFQFYNPEFLRNYGTGVANGSLWTIAIEIQFYIITPLLYYLTRRSNISWFFLIAIFIGLNQLMVISTQESILWKLFFVSFAPWIYMFIFGAWVSTKPDLVERVRKTPLPVIFFAYISVEIVCFYLGLQVAGNEINPLSFFFLSVLIFKLAYYKPNTSSSLLGKNDISYGIYIYHMPVVNFMLVHNLSGSLVDVFLCLIFVFILAVLSWRYIERPALRLKKRSLRMA